ncbi:hypothetical protein CFRA_08945 [Corynebacterium frankenforstense DSM 45800]|uniref:Growth inhibitor PemK n=1 Tax=Corynebacterium frankenforstense DSM 45800 TaxID=1437875 RepID=A0A1L7CU20_9CORY|nr:hypothetical protein [Corynebacterium frankenforstense]APT89355.1 hypothetical protein CFRA_08945 [Corynebacterium frankenforstense DSM 45800]
MPSPPARTRLGRLLRRVLPDAPPIEAGLARINARLGRGTREDDRDRAQEAVRVHTTDSVARALYYAPGMDGQAEPGEVVFIWAPSDGADAPLRERAILVVGHNRNTVLGLLISPNPEHADDDRWLGIGTGDFDASGRSCWVRLDRVLEVSELGIRRQGIFLPRGRFDRIAAKLRSRYGWS